MGFPLTPAVSGGTSASYSFALAPSSFMAGPVTTRFVEAIETTLARSIVKMAMNKPKYVVFYLYHRQSPFEATPLAMVSKYERGLTDEQFKVRIYDQDIGGWEYADVVVSRRTKASAFVAKYHTPHPCRDLGIGIRVLDEHFAFLSDVPVHHLRHPSVATQWLMESEEMLSDFLDQFEDRDEALNDLDEQGEWVEEKHVFDELFHDQIDFLLTVAF
jgi:hypothetical protein